VSEVAAELGLPFTDSKAVAVCRNKERTRFVLDSLGVRNPRHQVPRTLAEAGAFCASVGFPVVLKPSKGSGSAGVTLCSNEVELAAMVPRMLEDCTDTRELLQIEEFVPGPVVGVETVTYKGRTKVLGITDRGVAGPHPNFTAISWTFPAQVAPETEKQLKDIVGRVLTHIGYGLGFTHTEVVLGAKGPVLVEINPRLPGVNIAHLMATTLGIDVLGIMVDMFTGRDLGWLIEKELCPRYGMTEFAVKPDRNGRVRKMAGIDLARRYPGIVSVLEGLHAGDEVVDRHHLLTFGARIFARGDTAFESLACARAASTAIQLEVGE
jgi:biotin carboxylase